MKRMFALLTALALACALAACGAVGPQSDPGQSQSIQADSPSTPTASSQPDEEVSTGGEGSSVLVACFSATGNTQGIAQHLQAVLGADLYQIVPAQPYTQEDLDYSNDSCRANQEQNDPAARPAMAGTLEHPEDYDVVFLGYPIWWGKAPKVIYTFLERCDLGDATVVPFCTSGSSGIGGSLDDLRVLAPHAQWLDGQRFHSGAGQEEVARWVDSLDLNL